MAARRAERPRSVLTTAAPRVADANTERALGAIRTSLELLQEAPQRDVVTFDLAIGTNKVRHGLARPVRGYTITATTVSAAFAHAIDTTNPRPDLEVWISVVGTDQDGAVIEVW
jgi:hypothetical protein